MGGGGGSISRHYFKQVTATSSYALSKGAISLVIGSTYINTDSHQIACRGVTMMNLHTVLFSVLGHVVTVDIVFWKKKMKTSFRRADHRGKLAGSRNHVQLDVGVCL